MKRRPGILFFLLLLLSCGCNKDNEPVKEGELELSSQLFGVDSYFIYGYNFKNSDFIKYSYPFSGSVPPDIINDELINPDGSIAAPSFVAPSRKNGFNLLGEFSSLSDAREFYENYKNIEEELKFVAESDTVKLYQVWLQKTQLDHYVKMLVKDILYYQDGMSGADYVVVSMDFVYQDNGTFIFP